MRKEFSDYRVLTLDCYGTLIDWERGIWDAFQPILTENKRLDLPKASVLQQFASLESKQQSVAPKMRYSSVLQTVHA
ncbi:MAG TPA: hypothetical protein QF695_16240, partial [Arenicellales bacterium]|nr:hypothetical protein [Arenicellales bacterium]